MQSMTEEATKFEMAMPAHKNLCDIQSLWLKPQRKNKKKTLALFP